MGIVKKISWVLLCFTGLALAQTVEYSEVEATGVAATEPLAIQDGLRDCVAQVCGVNIASETKLEMVSTSAFSRSNNGGSDHEMAAQKLQERLATSTRGRVASYQVLFTKKIDKNEVEVRVRAKIAKAIAPENSRMRFALFPLRSNVQAFPVENSLIPSEVLSVEILQAITDRLVQTRKLSVLDRSYVEEIAAEQAFTDEQAVLSEWGSLGNMLGADFVLTGVLRTFEIKEESVVVPSSGVKLNKTTGWASISISIISVETGQIQFSDTVDVSVPIKRGTASPSALLCMALADKIVKQVVEQLFPVLVIACETPESVVLNQGGGGIRVGDQYDVFSVGDAVKDPYTKETLGGVEKHIGLLEILRSKPKTSDAKVLEGGAEIQAALSSGRLVLCRPLSRLETPQQSPPKKTITDKDIW